MTHVGYAIRLNNGHLYKARNQNLFSVYKTKEGAERTMKFLNAQTWTTNRALAMEELWIKTTTN